MKLKHLLTIFMLLFVGAISAFSLTGNLPESSASGVTGEETSDEPTQTGPNIEELKTLYNAIGDSIADRHPYKLFYEGITKTDIYGVANEVISATPITISQDSIDKIVLQLKNELRKAPFNYVNTNWQAQYEEYYGTWSEGDATYMEVFRESDFGGLKMMVDSILTQYKNEESKIPQNEIYGEPDTKDPNKEGAMIPGKRGIIRQYNECVTNRATSFTNKKEALKILIDSVSHSIDLSNGLKNKDSYKTPSSWYNNNDGFTYTDHNFTNISLYFDYLNEEISFFYLKNVYLGNIQEIVIEIKRYFTNNEQDASNSAWGDATAPITIFKNLLNNASIDTKNNSYHWGDISYPTLNEMQSEMNKNQATVQGIPQILENKLATNKTTLQNVINMTLILQAQLKNTEQPFKDLEKAVTAANKTLYSDTNNKILSVYTDATLELQNKYNEAKTYYDNFKNNLNTNIKQAENDNEIWKDSELSTKIATSKTVAEKANTIEVRENEIQDAIEQLKIAHQSAHNKFTLNDNIKKLKNYQTVYGDEDHAIEVLLEEAGKATSAIYAEMVTKTNNKLNEIETAWGKALANLNELIKASISFYDNWHTIKGEELFGKLKTAYENARKVYNENNTDTKRNIVALIAEYSNLFKVYAELGGESDPFMARTELIAKIAEAEQYYHKYKYQDLQIAINEANSYKNSETINILVAQKAVLGVEIEEALKQYEAIINSIDVNYSATIIKLNERYENFWLEEDKAFLNQIADSIAKNTEVVTERACTNIPLLQDYNIRLENIKEKADTDWHAAIEALHNAILSTELKYNSNYSKNEELKNAIDNAQTEYGKIQDNYKTIASVKQLQKELDQVLASVEGNDRKNIANQFVKLYTDIATSFKLYGSDENTPNGSNSATYLSGNKELYDELISITGSDITYSLSELSEFVSEAQQVKDTYLLFCTAAKTLDETLDIARKDNENYYQEDTNTSLYKAISAAELARQKSFCQDSIEKNNYALKDTLSQTERLYKNTLANMKIARNTAKTKHNIYYGSDQNESEILTVYDEAQYLLSKLYIHDLLSMTDKLNNCYKEAESKCAVKEAEIQTLITKADLLNLLMEDKTFDDEIAEAINAKHSNDGRIASITKYLAILQDAYSKQLGQYINARIALNSKLTEANILLEKHSDKNLSDTVTLAMKVLEYAEPTVENASKYKELVDATEWLTIAMEKVDSQLKVELNNARNALEQTLAEALAKHNLYYGAENTDSTAILEVYNIAKEYITSDNPVEITDMIDKVKQSCTQPSVECSQKEAVMDDLIRKATPLVTLMKNAELSKIIIKARECRNRMNGRIVAIDSIRPSLQTGYEADCLKYDDAANELSDSIMIAKALLEIRRDEALQNAIIASEALLDAADKTSTSSTKYAELMMQTPALAKEIERVRILIKESETGIYAPGAEDREIEIYTTQGFLVKRVKLSDSNPFRNIPDGVYIVDRKKVYIHAK